MSSAQFKCSICKIFFSKYPEVINHISKSHPKREKSIMDLVDFTTQFTRKTCHICGESFAFKNFTSHMMMHPQKVRTETIQNVVLEKTFKKSFKCELCEKSYTSNWGLKQHISNIHSGGLEKRYKCEKCNKSFHNNFYLNHHQQSHTGKLLYSCQICGQKFSYRNNLKKHETFFHDDKRSG